MRRHFEDYHQCHAAAQKQANATGLDFGIERVSRMVGGGWIFFGLPCASNRQGHELTCEVVSSEKNPQGPESPTDR